MLPSALPAFSPPSGVSSAPSRAASSGLTAARSSAGASSSTAAVKRISVFMAAPSLSPVRARASERELDAGCNEATIVEQVVLARTPVVGVRDVQIPPVADAGRESHGARVPAADKSSAGTGGVSARVLGPGEVREQVPVADHAVVLEPPGDHVTPGELGGERGTWLDLAGKLGVAAEVRIAAEVRTRPVVAQTKAHGAAAQPVLETRHVVPAGFDEQHRLGSLENIGEDLGGRDIEVPGVLQLPAADGLSDSETAELIVSRDRRQGRGRRGRTAARGVDRTAELQALQPRLEGRQRGVDELDIVELQRHVVAECNLALQCRASLLDLGVEGQAQHLDVAREFLVDPLGPAVLGRRNIGSLVGDIAARTRGVGADGGVLLGRRRAQVPALRGGTLLADRRAGRDRRRERQARRERLRGRTHGAGRSPGVAEARLRTGGEGDHGKAARVVEEVQAELCALAEVRQVELEIDTELAGLKRLVIAEARDGLEVADQRAAKGAEVHAEVGNGAKAEDHAVAAGPGYVARAEVRSVRLDDVLVPIEEVQQLAAQVLR